MQVFKLNIELGEFLHQNLSSTCVFPRVFFESSNQPQSAVRNPDTRLNRTNSIHRHYCTGEIVVLVEAHPKVLVFAIQPRRLNVLVTHLIKENQNSPIKALVVRVSGAADLTGEKRLKAAAAAVVRPYFTKVCYMNPFKSLRSIKNHILTHT